MGIVCPHLGASKHRTTARHQPLCLSLHCAFLIASSPSLPHRPALGHEDNADGHGKWYQNDRTSRSEHSLSTAGHGCIHSLPPRTPGSRRAREPRSPTFPQQNASAVLALGWRPPHTGTTSSERGGGALAPVLPAEPQCLGRSKMAMQSHFTDEELRLRDIVDPRLTEAGDEGQDQTAMRSGTVSFIFFQSSSGPG